MEKCPKNAHNEQTHCGVFRVSKASQAFLPVLVPILTPLRNPLKNSKILEAATISKTDDMLAESFSWVNFYPVLFYPVNSV